MLTGCLETLPRMNEWKEEERGRGQRMGIKKVGGNRGIREEVGNDERHSYPLEIVSAAFPR